MSFAGSGCKPGIYLDICLTLQLSSGMWKAGRIVQEPSNRRSPAPQVSLKPSEGEAGCRPQRIRRANPREMTRGGTCCRVPMAKPEGVCKGSCGQALCWCDLKLTWYLEHHLTDQGSGISHAGST